MTKNKQPNWFRSLLILGIIWLAGALCDRLWFALDHSVPPWDHADYLNGAMNYWQALQTPQWFDGSWWRSLWLLSSKIPPLTYILTVPFLNLFGTSPDAATLVMLLYSAILLVSVYGLGVELFSVSVGLWAAGLCQLLPGLYFYRLEFLLDYPLTAVVTLSFWCLTVWKLKSNGKKEKKKKKENSPPASSASSAPPAPPAPPASPLLTWLWAAAFGLSLGLALMVKQTALFFLSIPVLWVLGGTLLRRNWGRLAQLLGGLCLSVLVFGPWYRTNWLLIFTSGKRATIDSAIAEGDPALNTLDAWNYYGKVLPYLLSWPLLLVPIVGLLIYWGRKRNWRWTWLVVFLLGGYFLSSLNINKDARYILPLLPVLSLVLAAGLLCWTGRWRNHIRCGTVGVCLVLMLLNLFPLGGASFTQILSPYVQHYAYLGQRWPHEKVIEKIIETSPYLRSTLGVLPSTAEINQHNFSYYGGRANSQVSGRQVGVREKEVEQDARSLDWFLTKTGDQGSVPEAQGAIVKLVEQGSDFQLQNSWQLPDRSTLKLYHRIKPSVEVQPLSQPRSQVQLEHVTFPDKSPPGVPVPVTYEWSGSWEQLQSGLVLLTWHHEKSEVKSEVRSHKSEKDLSMGSENSTTGGQTDKSFQNLSWLHDHGIGMGALHPGRLNSNQFTAAFQVIERMAMLPGTDVGAGNYTLEATYLNRKTGEIYPIPVPPVTLKIDPAAAGTPAPELDLVTQLRTVAPGLSDGKNGLEPIFAQTARINQYDPIQDYLVQAEQALSYRLEQGRNKNLNWAYAIALSRVLQQDVSGAIAALKQVIQLDSQNPYPYAYLAFVYLYDWRPQAAQEALKPALTLNPEVPELQALSGIAALMQGNIFKAWHELSRVTLI
ncbi:MAG: glycosyltransferase family 39 protein [Xenococcaceae cyanobacterium]